MLLGEQSRVTAPRGDLVVTVEVTNADGGVLLLRRGGRTISDAVDDAVTEAAEMTDRMSDLTPDDEEYESVLATAIDDTQAVRAWYGHHDNMPAAAPDFED